MEDKDREEIEDLERCLECLQRQVTDMAHYSFQSVCPLPNDKSFSVVKPIDLDSSIDGVQGIVEEMEGYTGKLKEYKTRLEALKEKYSNLLL